MKKKLSIVIGGSKGIGKSIKENLSNRGDKVIVAARNVEKIKNIFHLDLSKDESIKNFYKTFKKKKIDNLIFSQRYRGNDPEEEFSVMVKSTEKIISMFKNLLNKNSSIVILSSVSTRGVLLDQNVSYHLIRGALEQLTKFFAVKLGKKLIRVNCIMASRAIKSENKKFYLKKNNLIRKNLERITPLGRMSSSNDVANVVNFLTDSKSSYITGEKIAVDGGLSLINQEHILYK